MRRIVLCFLVLAMTVEFSPRAVAQATATPGWLAYLGDGSEGDYSCTSGTCTLGGEHWVSSFTVSSSATVVTRAGNNTIIIRSTGACTVNGTISNSVNTAGGGGITVNGDFGGAGGGGGGGTVAGTAGKITVGDGGLPIVNAGNGGAAGGGTGGAANSPDRGQYHQLLSGGSFWPVGGSVGGKGGGNGSGIGGGNGGLGGGPVILICGSIDFSGTIDVSGGAGAPSPANNTGGGGGGGAGYVIFSALNYVNNNGTLNLSGGAGGSCNSHSGCGPGGSGGSGFNYSQTIH